MKFKFLSILMAAAVAVAFTSCGDKSNASGSTSNENNENKTEVTETNDGSVAAIEKDAKDFIDKAYALFKNVKSAEDLENAHNEADRMFKERLNYYKEKNDNYPELFEQIVEKEKEKGLEDLVKELDYKYNH